MNYKEFRKVVEQIAPKADTSDIDWLFCEVAKKSRTELKADFELSKIEQKILKKYANKLSKGVPVSQIVGFCQFGDYKILVDKKVLSPRAETEELADICAKDILKNGKNECKVLELCTGSGCIAIFISKRTNAKVLATDISLKALKVADKNAHENKADVKFLKSDMFKKVWGHFDYIICNPPYIDKNDKDIDINVKKYEPALALFAKDNGYEFYKIIAQKAKYYMLTGSKIYLEVGKGMAKNVADLFEEYSNTQIIKDMQNIERFVIVTK